MSADDREELEQAIAYMRGVVASEFAPRGTHRIAAERVIAAAEAHLATLPREVTYTRYLVVTDRDELGPYLDRSDSESIARRRNGIVVTMTGKALLPAGKE